VKRVRELGLVKGRGALPRGLLAACHSGRLEGGLSISLRATPDEVLGALVYAMGGAAKRLKLLDVRATTPPVLEVAFGELHEKWEVEGVEGLIHNLDDLLRDEADARLLVVLGEWEDMLQVWALGREPLRRLLEGRELDDARNAATLRRLLEPREAWD
jgi:hypothetical protein